MNRGDDEILVRSSFLNIVSSCLTKVALESFEKEKENEMNYIINRQNSMKKWDEKESEMK